MNQHCAQAAAQACCNRHEKEATRITSWTAALLAAALVVVASGTALANEKETFRQPADGTAMNSEMKRIPKMTVAFIRGTWSAAHVSLPARGCGPAWDKLMAWAEKNGLVHKDMVYAGVSHDDPSTTQSEKAQYDACISVPEGTKGDGEVTIGEIAGQNYAVFVHQGPYGNLKETYAHIYRTWLPNAERKVVSGPVLEIYKTPAMDTPPEKLVTEVCVPLAE